MSVAALLAAGLAVHAALTVPALWARGNADEEADFFAEAIRALPPEPVLFVRLGEGDRPRWDVHRGYPDHLPLTRGRGDTVLSVTDFFDVPRSERRAFFYLGVRCYAASRELRLREDAPDLGGRLHPLCEEMRRRYRLTPVAGLARELPNHPDADFPWYPTDRATLPVGLYEIGAPGDGEQGPRRGVATPPES